MSYLILNYTIHQFTIAGVSREQLKTQHSTFNIAEGFNSWHNSWPIYDNSCLKTKTINSQLSNSQSQALAEINSWLVISNSLLMLNVMTQQQFNDLLNALRKEAMSNMIKTAIRQQFPEPLASQYCQRFDDFKMVVDLLEYKAKQNGR